MFKNVVKEQLKVPAHFDYLGELRDFVTRIGRKHGVHDKIINAFKLSIDEAGSNIIRHAYREFDEPGFILLRVVVRKASMTVSLIDQGKYFDPRFVKNPDLNRYVEIGKKGGLGIFIIRKLMDEIDYRKTEEGNELRLTKYLDAEKRKSRLPSPVSSIPLSLKAKYFIRTAAALTLVICLGYLYFYVQAASDIRSAVLHDLKEFGTHIDSLLTNEPTIPQDKNDTYLFVRSIHQDNINKIYEIIITDQSGRIQGHIRGTDDYSKWLEPFAPPEKSTQLQEKLYQCTLNEPGPDKQQQKIDVYDYISPILDRQSGAVKGELHIRRLKSNVDKAIAAKRWDDARLVLIILVASYVGALILIYVLLNPFRKLADWIRALDHGDEVEDEMDIDSSTEIGEIAKAFSEITSKFRESQKHLVEQEQLQKEMQVAQEIQQTLLPTDFPELEGYEISSLYQAAKEVGGDYYDFVEVDKDTLGIVVADVSGKGVPGSLVMTMIRTALRTEARGVKDAAEVLARVNDFVVNDMKKGMFVTIFYVIIDSKRRRLNYASAGHNPMILYRPSTGKTYYLNPKGFPIGIQLAETDLFRKSIESDTIQLAEDDILILYTDGITEAMNGRRDLFGEERLLKVIRDNGHLRVKPFVEKLRQEIESFTEGAIQYDDITLVTIKEKTSPEKEELRRARLAHRAIMAGKSIKEACEEAGITTYAYYNKYKKQFEEHGIDSFEIDEEVSVEAKHISIEEKTKIFDIIRNHPEYGAKRIAEELNTEKYGFLVISENKIYEELVRSRLNTRQLREAFVARGGRSRRRMKPPGTPMLTLDGRVIIDRETTEPGDADAKRKQPPVAQKPPTKEKVPPQPPVEIKQRTPQQSDIDVDMEVVAMPIEELLDKSRESREEDLSEFFEEQKEESHRIVLDTDTEEAAETGAELRTEDFERLIQPPDLEAEAEISGFTEPGEDAADVLNSRRAEVQDDFKLESSFVDSEGRGEPSPSKPGPHKPEDDFEFTAFEDLLKMEILSSFEDEASNIVVEGQEQKAVDEEHHLADLPSKEDVFEEKIGPSEEPEISDSGDLPAPVEEQENEAEHPVLPEFQTADDTSEPVPEDAASSELPILGDDTIEILTGVGVSKNLAKPSNRQQPEKPPARPTAELLQAMPQRVLSFAKGGSAENHFKESVAPGSDPSTQQEVPDKEEVDRHAVNAPETNLKTGDVPEGSDTQGSAPQPQDREQFLIAGLRFYKRHEFDHAIRQFEEAIRLFPDFKEAHSVLGNAYFRKGYYDRAFAAYRKVLELDPEDTTAHENIGVIYANQGDLERAIAEWKMVLKIEPSRIDIQKKINKALELLKEAELVSS